MDKDSVSLFNEVGGGFTAGVAGDGAGEFDKEEAAEEDVDEEDDAKDKSDVDENEPGTGGRSCVLTNSLSLCNQAPCSDSDGQNKISDGGHKIGLCSTFSTSKSFMATR